jgi:UDPglucose 6-dehydrogenase
MGARIAVIGAGHVGLVMAAGLAELGHDVTAVDVNDALIVGLRKARVPFHEAGLVKLVEQGLASGQLHFTNTYDEAIPEADFIFLAVDTPPTLAGAADLRNIRNATRSIAGTLNGKAPIIINKSTSPIGTGETIEALLWRALGDHHPRPRLASNPEFLRQGQAVHDFFNPDRIVVGARNEADARAVADLYAGLGGTRIFTDLRTAEMIKYVANSFLATRISFANEVARLCEGLGVDVEQVIEGVAMDPRIGGHFFQAGVGFGGSCLPKDVAALRYLGQTYGIATPVLSAVQEVNQTQRTSAVRRLREALGTLEGRSIAVWGVTFKGGTEDVRESPAVEIIGLLMNEGAEIRAYDPAFPDGAPLRVREALHETALDAVRGADALAILTDWDEFASVPLTEVSRLMRGNVLFDGRNILSREDAEERGFRYVGVGRGRTMGDVRPRPLAVA